MKNLRKLHVLAAALVVVLCMMATTLFVAASGTGTLFDPYTYGADELPTTVTVPAGEEPVFYQLPIGGWQMTVTSEGVLQ